MPGLISAAADTLLDSLGTTYSWVQLHTGDPGPAGTDLVATEATRVQATWAAATGGTKSNSGALTWTNVSGAEDYTHFSVWDASTAGTCGFTGTVTANAVQIGDQFEVPDGDLDISFAVAA